jgi:hydrogenase maturation protease
VIVIGVGNSWRGDDAAGLAVAERLRGAVEVVEHEGDGAALLAEWRDRDHVVVVDAAASDAAPGSVRRFDANAGPLPARLLRSSTHAFGVADAVELARALACLPRRLEVYAIEGADFSAGAALSPPVAEAVEQLAASLSGPRATASG